MKCPSLWHAWSRRKWWRRLDLDGSRGQRLKCSFKTVNAGKSSLGKWRLWRGGQKIKGWEIGSGKSRGGNRVRDWERESVGGWGCEGLGEARRGVNGGEVCGLRPVQPWALLPSRHQELPLAQLCPAWQPAACFEWRGSAKQFWIFSMSWCFPMCPLWNWQTQTRSFGPFQDVATFWEAFSKWH